MQLVQVMQSRKVSNKEIIIGGVGIIFQHMLSQKFLNFPGKSLQTRVNFEVFLEKNIFLIIIKLNNSGSGPEGFQDLTEE